MRLFSKLGIRSKILMMLLLVAIGSIAVIGYLGYETGTTVLRKLTMSQFAAIQTSKSFEIESYFDGLQKQVQTFSEDLRVVEAMKAFDQSFHELNTKKIPAEWRQGLLGYYDTDNFATSLRANLFNVGSPSSYLPVVPAAQYLQYFYIVKNPNPPGKRAALVDAQDGSEYSKVHALYHPLFEKYDQKFGYHDMFLVDTETGDVVYTVQKGIDFASNCISGALNVTNLSRAFQGSRRGTFSDYVKLVDFESYLPSGGAPAAFIASPIYDGHNHIGDLAFQISADDIDRIMTNDRHWQESGMGRTGESFLVGPDQLMRSNSRLLLEDPQRYLEALRKAKAPQYEITRIQRLGTNILQQRVTSACVDAALQGKNYAGEFTGYLGTRLVGWCGPLHLGDLDWVLETKVSLDEFSSPLRYFRRRLTLWGLALLLAGVAIALLLARAFVRPVKALMDGARRFGAGETNVVVPIRSGDEFGELTSTFNSMVRNIAEAQHSLRDSEASMRAIFENAQIGIGFFEIDRQQLTSNRALQEMLGCTEKELNLLEKWDEITHPDERASCAQRYAELLQGKREKDEYVQRFIRPDGRIVFGSGRFSLLRDAAGKPQFIVTLTEDITERRRVEAELVTAKEAAEAATKAKSDFLANMSHEIRTPMNAIIGMTHLALKTQVTPKQEDYLTKIKTAADALLGIINDILDFSKIEAGKLSMEKTDFRLEQVLENLSTVVSQKAHDKSLEFLISTQHDLPPNLIGDPLRLGQILINLVNNAVKFTEHGEVLVSVGMEEQVSDRIKLKFSVRDSGIGMTPEQTARLFQAFSQADTSTTRKYGGTGLGLSISKRLVEMMDGNIWVESEHGAGSTFQFTAWFGIGSGKVERKRFIPDLAGLRALVVDDNTQACEILTDALRVFGLRAESVSCGEDAIRELAGSDSQDPYQMVLMDWHMPGMDGLQASRLIKRGDRLKHVPKIVMVTAFGREDVRTQAEEIGIDAYLLKPVSPSLLYDTLMDLFGITGPEGTRVRSKKEETASHDASGIRILLVEDNEMNQQVATELLQSAGGIVTIANHGGEAVKILREGEQPLPFDIVFMDLQMPEMDGFTATKLLRAESRFQGLPIVAMTAHALVEERERCLDAGMNDHVSKPIDPDALFATLTRWVKPRHARTDGAAVKPSRVADEVIVPEIEGVDTAGGLKRVAGNKRLYRDLLSQFAGKQGDAGAQISVALESGDRRLAERIAHTVKGVAGNLGIKPIHSAAEKLEKAIREGDAAALALVGEFSSLLGPQVETIRRALQESTPVELEEKGKVEFNAEAAATAVARLRVLLEASDADAEEAFSRMQDAMAGRVEPTRLSALGAAINDFDFEGALAKLHEIAKEYSLSLEM